jgi:hypothetical protein
LENKNQASPQMTLKIIWGALLSSHFMYVYVLRMVIEIDSEKGLENPILLPALSSAALMTYALGFFLPKILLNNEKKAGTNLSQEDMANKFLVPMIIRLALFEGAALMGFGLSFIAKEYSYYLVLLSVNVVLFLLNFPSDQKIKDAFSI